MTVLTADSGVRLAPTGKYVQVPGAAVAWTSRGDGAVSKTLYERDQDVVWVTDFMSPEEQADVFAGTLLFDHQPAIQAAIDYAVYRDTIAVAISGGPRVRCPGGLLRLDRPVQVGYGVDFRSVVFEGEGIRVGGSFGEQGVGTSFVVTFNDAPGIVVQGGRNVVLRGFTITGRNLDHVVALLAAPAMTDLVATNWIDPSFPASASSRFAPYAAIAIDPYGGAQPGVHYPAVNYPAFLGAVGQYNKELSSATSIRDVSISGFYVGVVQQPCDADGNGDFTHLDNVSIFFCGYGVAWGNSQSRVLSLDNSNVTACNTGFATTVFGRRIGQPAVACVHCSFGQLIRIFSIPNLGFGEGPALIHCFGESLYSIGLLGASASVSGSTLFEDVELGFSWWEIYGIPTYVLDNGGGLAFHAFRNVLFYLAGFVGPDIGAWGGLVFRGINFDLQSGRCYSFEGCSAVFASEPTQLWQKCALNATGGLAISFNGSRLLTAYSWRLNHVYNLTTGADLGATLCTQANPGARASCLPAYSTTAIGLVNGNDPGVPAYFRFGGVDANGAGGVVTQVGRNITFTFSGADANYLQNFGGDVGDVIICNSTGAVFWVYSRTADVFSARAMSGFDRAGNLLVAIPNAAQFSVINCRHYVVTGVCLYGDIAGGSNVITNVKQGNYTPVADIGVLVSVGDWLAVDFEVDQLFFPFGDNRITAIDNVAHTITMAGNATVGVASVHARLGIFTRPAMPNGTPTP